MFVKQRVNNNYDNCSIYEMSVNIYSYIYVPAEAAELHELISFSIKFS